MGIDKHSVNPYTLDSLTECERMQVMIFKETVYPQGENYPLCDGSGARIELLENNLALLYTARGKREAFYNDMQNSIQTIPVGESKHRIIYTRYPFFPELRLGHVVYTVGNSPLHYVEEDIEAEEYLCKYVSKYRGKHPEVRYDMFGCIVKGSDEGKTLDCKPSREQAVMYKEGLRKYDKVRKIGRWDI